MNLLLSLLLIQELRKLEKLYVEAAAKVEAVVEKFSDGNP